MSLMCSIFSSLAFTSNKMEILNSDITIATAPFFLSAPTSPDRHLLDALLFSDDSTDFEFDTSKRYCFQEEQPAAVSFADKLFSNGTVLPLELPPRLRGRSGSPTGPGSVLKTWQNLWRTDFDPFVAALEKVRMGDRRGRRWESFGRRARSLSPFKGDYGGSEEDLSSLLNDGSNKSLDHLGPLEGQVALKLARPRGLEFARRVRLVELKKSSHVGKEKEKEPEDRGMNTASSAMIVRKKSFLRRLSFKSSRAAMEKNKISEMVKFKMDFLRSNSRLLCLGYGMKTNS